MIDGVMLQGPSRLEAEDTLFYSAGSTGLLAVNVTAPVAGAVLEASADLQNVTMADALSVQVSVDTGVHLRARNSIFFQMAGGFSDVEAGAA